MPNSNTSTVSDLGTTQRANEFDEPPSSKIRLVVTICSKLCEEMKVIHEGEVQDAQLRERVEPDWSNTVEMLLRKGVRVYKNQQRKNGPSSPDIGK